MDYSGKVKVMKKTLAALFAILCVAGGMRTAATTTNANTKNNSYVITASAATTPDPEPGKFAETYGKEYPYYDTTMYTVSMSTVNLPSAEDQTKANSSWQYGDKYYKIGQSWLDEKTGNSYEIYKLTIKENTGKKSVVRTEYRLGLAALKPTTLDFKGTDAVTIPERITAYLNEKDAGFAASGLASKNVTILGPSSIASTYVKTVDFTGIEYIGDSALKDCKYITEITIPANVKYVGSGVFENSGLKKLTVNNVMPVVPVKFCSGTNLTEIKFTYPQYIRRISNEAFKGTPLSHAIVTSSDYKGDANYEFIEIGDSAFEGCANIKELNFPDNVTMLGKKTFKDNTALKTLTFGKNLIAADNSCFYGCTALTSITWNEVVQTLAGSCFTGCTSLKTVSGMPTTLKDWVPEDATLGWGVGDGVFSGCTSLESIILPKSLARIPASMFEGDTKLKTVQFGTKDTTLADVTQNQASGDNITKIKKSAFADCASLTKVDFGKTTHIEEKAFLNCKNMTSFNVGECIVVGTSALENCSSLKEITLLSDQYGGTLPTDQTYKDPNKTNSSEGYVFKGCTSAKKITIKTDDKIKLSSGMFQNCTALTDIGGDLSKIQIIGKDCFSGSTGLTHLNMPILKIIEGSAFANCTALKQITDDPTLPIKAEDYGDKAFQNCSELKFALTGDISTIGANAFQNSGVTSLNINGMVGGTVVIGNSAFADCENLTSATINSQDAKKFSVGTGVFTNCPNLTTAVYDGPIVTASMFKNCPKLKDIKILADVFNANAFENCTSLQSVLNKNDGTLIIAKEINGSAFRGCTSLINSSADEKTIFKGNQQYSGCTSLKTANVSTLTPGMFEDCTSLNNVKTTNVKSVPAGTFQNCTSLESFSFANIESIGNAAFANTGLKAIELPASVSSIGNNAFNNCAKSTSAKIGNKDATIGTKAFGFNANKQIPNFIVSGISGSTAEKYATANKLNFMNESGTISTNQATTTTKATTTTTKAATTTKATTKASSTTTKAGTTTTKANATTTTSKATTQKLEGTLGDTNGDGTVDVSDAVLIMQSLSNPSKFGPEGTAEGHITEAGKNRGDVESRGNGLTNKDALAIQKYKLQLIPSLPESTQK